MPEAPTLEPVVGLEPYERLRAAILAGELQPNERLVELDVMARFGLSRGSIRIALVRLEVEGLVERERYRGAKVRMIEPGEAAEIIEVRSVLEALAARRAAVRADDADVERLRDLLSQIAGMLGVGDLIGASDAEVMLHDAVLELSDHETVRHVIAGLSSQVVRYKQQTLLRPGRAQASLAEHAALVEAIAAGDADAAEAAMRCHLANVAASLRATR